MSFLPEGYTIPQSKSKYLDLKQDGKHKIRILSEQPFIFYEYFTTENKPVVLAQMPEQMPTNIQPSKYDGGKKEINEMWGLVIYNHDIQDIQILKFNQKTIKNKLKEFSDNPDVGHPKNYDITLTRAKDSKSGKTEYSLLPSLNSTEVPADALAKAKTIKLSELAVAGGKPFDGADADVQKAVDAFS
jgi:hypothetical protein